MIDSLNPFSIEDMLCAHNLMMWTLVDIPGVFRDCDVGIFKGPVPIHIAPGFEDVPELMNELIEWAVNTDCHPLIKGCIFHCRFEFIHPFVDGNGRMGRLWHSLILSKWDSIFEWLPIETWIKVNQKEYYARLNESDKGDITEFIRFMLRTTKMTIDELYDETKFSDVKTISERERMVLDIILKNEKVTAKIIAENMEISERTVKRYLSTLVEKGIVERIGSDKIGHWKVM